MNSDSINIPEDRISALIGPKGFSKRKIENKGKVKLNISNNGNVTIISKEIESLLAAKDIVEAVGRGFNPNIALRLFNEEFSLEIIDLISFTRSKARLELLRSRVIGRKGTAGRQIEIQTNTKLSIKGKTVSIIGKSEDVYLARRAIEMILDGSHHGSSFRWLKDQLSN